MQGWKIALVRSYLRVPQAAGQVKILIFLVKIKFSPYMPIIFLMQFRYLRPAMVIHKPRLDCIQLPSIHILISEL